MKVERVYATTPGDTTPTRLIAAGVGRVPAGFPSPSQDYSDTKIDLTQMLVRDELSTFIVRVSGASMEGAGIYDGDKLIVDRGIEPRDGHVVVAIVDGEMTVKRLRITPTGVVLQAENAEYPDVVVAELSDLMIWGVATTCLHRLN
ncbi:MAG TPA: translesion error-prone DNA polymerase V autoproteolytic subunit [Enteractinococcus sp.]